MAAVGLDRMPADEALDRLPVEPVAEQEFVAGLKDATRREFDRIDAHLRFGEFRRLGGRETHDSDPGHVVFYTSDGETRQEYEIILLGRPVSGEPRANDEASAAAWFTVAELDGLDIHASQWRQLRDWLDGTHPHID